jgi:hypothetical protein
MTLLGNVHILCIVPSEIRLIGTKVLELYILPNILFFLYPLCFVVGSLEYSPSWANCSEYVVGFSGAAFQSYSTRMQAEEAYQAFLENITEKGEHVSNKWCCCLIKFVQTML